MTAGIQRKFPVTIINFLRHRNNWIENQMRSIALDRKHKPSACSLRPGQRKAAVMILIKSANLNDHDPHAYLKDVME